ncbi:MAG: SigE family RNA polymerase sigma factor [Propionibacteriales bacterium]|nr:SigE family RNA polymerase sigma factor [Propionibacteriales bacterium]
MDEATFVVGAPAAVASFEAFVHATAATMHRTAVLLCGDHHLAEDLTQTAYAKVFASWRRVAGANDPVAYTRKVLVRTFLSHRRLRRSAERPVEVLPEIAGAADDASVRLDLLTALQSLAPDDRAVLVLRFWDDLSVADTARLLGTSDAACRQRTARALARIRVLMPDLEEDR